MTQVYLNGYLFELNNLNYPGINWNDGIQPFKDTFEGYIEEINQLAYAWIE